MEDTPMREPSPEVAADLDRLAAISRANPGDQAAMVGLWRRVYGLHHWVFIARGPLTNPHPFVGETEDGRFLFAFTTAMRAREGALHAGLSPAEAGLVMTVPLPGVIEWAAGFAAFGVDGIIFDRPRQGYFAPLANLIPMRQWFVNHPV